MHNIFFERVNLLGYEKEIIGIGSKLSAVFKIKYIVRKFRKLYQSYNMLSVLNKDIKLRINSQP